MKKLYTTAAFLGLTIFTLPYSIAAVPAEKSPFSENVHYKKLAVQQPVDVTDKTIITEFFSYGCPHCANFEPVLRNWQSNKHGSVVINKVPVGFHSQWVPLQRLYYTLTALHLDDTIGQKAFDSIHKNKTALYTDAAVIKWAGEQGIDKARFVQMYQSFAVDTKVNNANKLVKDYKIEGVPFVAVNGKYMVLNEKVNGYDEFVAVIDTIIKTTSKK